MSSSRCPRRTAIAAVLLHLLLAAPLAVQAQEFPAKPVRIVVPFAPGGGNDVFARQLAGRLGETLGQQVVVDNRPGAGGTVGTDAVAKAAPDGYTLLLGHTGTLAINPALYPKLPYDAKRDFVAVGPLAQAPLVLVVPQRRRGEDAGRTGRAGEGRRRAASQLRLERQRHRRPSGGELLEETRRRQAAARAVQGHRAGADRPARRPGAGDVQRHSVGAAACRGRAAARARRHRRAPQCRACRRCRRSPRAGCKGYESTLAYGLMAPKGNARAGAEDAVGGARQGRRLAASCATRCAPRVPSRWPAAARISRR